tara:strand:- start:218 stop:667 length:450 start_codon:yes stop_codon:yes gene_type:complete
MAIRDKNKKQFIQDRDENVFIGIDLPFRKSNGVEGWFESTTDTISAVKNNIKNLLRTHKGERYLQPNLGLNLREVLFEQMTDDLRLRIETDIIDTFSFWLPFVQIRNLEIDMVSPEDNNIGNNKLYINILFNISRDPNTLESVQVEIGD